MSDLGQLRGVGGQVRGLGVGHFRRIHYSSVMAERRRWTVVPALVSGVVTSIRGISRISVVVTPVPGISCVMHRFGSLRGVRRQMRLLGVSHFRRVDHPTVVGQRGRWSVIVSDIRPVIRLIRRVRWQCQRRQREAR